MIYRRPTIINGSNVTSYKIYGEDNVSNRILIGRKIYSNLSSLTEASKVSKIVPHNSGYQEFLNDMDDISLDLAINATLSEIDLYLGMLGLSETYPIERDRITKQKKINATYKSPYKKD